MSTSTMEPTSPQTKPRSKKPLIWGAVIVLILIGVVLGTKVVPNGDPLLMGEAAFDAEAFGEENFPIVRDEIEERALDATELAEAIENDADAAAEQYAQESAGGMIYSVTLEGVFGEGTSGIYEIDVDGVSDDLLIRMQVGPAINGTELRDATGMMQFGDFANQIQFQDAAAALNNEMKEEVLADLDTSDLEGKSVNVTGAFTLINPDAWLITPVSLEVQ